jgi:hypothetical protein
MASANRQEVVYVELDVLLDTRLGTVARMAGDEVAKAVLETGYHTRVSDRFPGVDKDAYQAQYKNRNVETLKRSFVTNAVASVRQLVAVLTEQSIKMPFHDGPAIVVNVFPYELTDTEKDELRKVIATWTEFLAPIELVRIQPEDLSPSHCKQTYSAMFVYEYEHWFIIHKAAFKEADNRMPEVTMYAPAIYFVGEPPTTEVLEELKKEAAHPFKATQVMASPFVHLQLVDAKLFSILSNRDFEPAYSPPPPSAAAQAVAEGEGSVPEAGAPL